MSTIPASAFVKIVPNVIGAGGSALDLIGLTLDNSTRVPIGEVLSFPSAVAVGNYFGLSSLQYAEAEVYFGGFQNSNALPGAQLWAQYNQNPVAAWLRGGPLALTLAQLQALSGSLTVPIDGYNHVISSISFAAYSSFSAIATAIEAAFTDPTEASFTASIGSSSTTCTSSGTTLTQGALASGYLSAGDLVSGTDSTNSLPAGCYIVAQLTGTPGGSAGATFQLSAAATPGDLSSCTVTGTSTVLDVTVCPVATIAIGQTLSGSTVRADTLITGQISGAVGGVGLYQLSGAAQGVASEAMTGVATAPIVTYDSTAAAFVITSAITGTPSLAGFATGTLATPLLLTAATGAVTSQGAAPAVPGPFMTALTQITQNWASFFTTFDPDSTAFIGSITGTTLSVLSLTSGTIVIGQGLTGAAVLPGTTITAGGGLSWTVSVSQTVAVTSMASFAPGGASGNTQKQLFAAWTSVQNNRYAYICEDTDITPTQTVPASTSLGHILQQNNSSGTNLNYEPSQEYLAAFVSGSIASIDFEETNGRVGFAYKMQTGLVAGVTNETAAFNLGGNPLSIGDFGNGYNYYGAIATANQGFVNYQRGTVSGPWLWLDSYVNQIWFNNALQLAILEGLVNVKSAPYNQVGYSLIASWCMDPINAAVNFGAIQSGVPLSAAQAAEVNNAAGLNIASTLTTRGWYLQIQPATAQVRGARGSPPCTLWYVDGGNIQAINLASIEVQ